MNRSAFRQRELSGTVKVAEILLSIVALLFVSLALFSQGSTGTIQGSVFDSSGGAIAGARVTLLDVARGTTRTLAADESGQYVAPALTAGTYTVRAESMGFRSVERSNVLVQVGTNVRVDLTLSPGEQTQTITVTEEIPAIDTTSATLGGTVSNQAIVALPLNGRNFMRLLELRPGVVTSPGSNSSSSSTNGRRAGADVLLVEGITQFDMATSNNLINGAGKGSTADSSSALPIDAIQEFNSQQNAPAEYGWRDGSIVNVGIKSGTNSLHGTAYAFGRNAKATDAANYFTGTVTPATMEQFGGTAGGPILKNKLFWFAAYEGLRIKINSINSVTVPSSIGLTPASADLSMVDACNAAKTAGGVINPLSAQLAGLDVATCKVSPATDTFENVFPYNPTTSNLFYPGNSATQPLNNGLGKLDWNLNDHNHLSFFYFDSRSVEHSGGSLQPYWNATGTNKTREYAGGWSWTPNSTWVNELKLGWAGALGIAEAGDENRLPSDPYPTGYSMNTGVTDRQSGGFPPTTLTGFAPLGVTGRLGARGPQGQFNIRDSVSYLRGKHAFKFGFEHVWVKFDDSSIADTLGNITFADLTHFLQGNPDSGFIRAGNADEGLRARWYASFVQDTWRINPRLTLTPGLRYEYQGPPHELHNHLGTFDPNSPGGIVQVGPGLPQSKLFNAEKAVFLPRIGLAWDIQGNGKTVLRGAISKLASNVSITALALQTPFGANFPSAGINRSGTDLNKSFPQTLSFGPTQLAWNTTGPIFPITSAAGPSCTVAVPCGTGATDPNYKRPKSVQWNIDIQRAITSRLTLDVAYVANHGYDEMYQVDLNAVPVGTAWTPALIASCIASASACTSTSTKNAQAALIAAARPYNAQFPYLNYIVRSTGSAGIHSNYNGLQVTLDSRNFHGVSFLSAYTYSHGLDQWSSSSQSTRMLADPNNPQLQYSSSDNDIRHRFRFSPTWAIPGRKSPGQMLEGWSASGILSIQGRFPWGAIDATKNDWVGTGENLNAFQSTNTGVNQFWNFSGPADAFNSTNIPIPCYGRLTSCSPVPTAASSAAAQSDYAACQTAAQAPYGGNPTLQKLALQSLANNGCYIQNGGILTPPAYGTNGNAGRNSFRGPSFRNVDFSISKTWHVGERYSAQFRTEFFNVFNHPSLGNPGTNPTTGKNAFGFTKTTPDSSNAVLGSGGPRHIQFGLKLAF